MPNHLPDQDPYTPPPDRLTAIEHVHDPTPQAIAGSGKIENKDYTKYIQWTPRKIAIVICLFTIPYTAFIVILAHKFSFMAALPFIIIPLILGSFVGLMYWLARAVL
jgi:hypothetical protein